LQVFCISARLITHLYLLNDHTQLDFIDNPGPAVINLSGRILQFLIRIFDFSFKSHLSMQVPPLAMFADNLSNLDKH
jgi:hypothetical protein